MIVVAIISCRNEEAYIANCARHLLENGVYFAVVDNGSTDDTAKILRRSDLRRGLVAYEMLPFDGTFRWRLILQAKEMLAHRLEADWFIHLDADEIMHSSRDGETLPDAIARLALEGANAINFNEFVFLPVDHDYLSDIEGPQKCVITISSSQGQTGSCGPGREVPGCQWLRAAGINSGEPTSAWLPSL